jgi:hypothetical protein
MKELIQLAEEKEFESNIDLIHKNYKVADGGKTNELLFYLWMCEVQKWLEDNYAIFVEIKTLTSVNEIFGHEVYLKSWRFAPKKLDEYLTKQEALQEGLTQALKLI